MSSNLADRIDVLFRTKLSPKGREYSYREVAAAVASDNNGRRHGEAISAAYIWGLRTGVKDNPTLKHLQALARFFEVSPAYFFDEELAGLSDQARLLAATQRDEIRRLALMALGLSEESLNVLLQLMRRVSKLEGVATRTSEPLELQSLPLALPMLQTSPSPSVL